MKNKKMSIRILFPLIMSVSIAFCIISCMILFSHYLSAYFIQKTVEDTNRQKNVLAQNIENVKASLIKESSSQEEKKIVSLLDQTDLTYILSGETEKKKYNGSIRIIADTSKGNSTGRFIDNSVKIKVLVTNNN